MLYLLIKKIGKTKSIILLTFAGSLLSVGLSVLINLLIFHKISATNIYIALLIPLLLTPFISIFFFNLLFQLDLARSQLLLQANTDALTGVHNRRYFFNYLEHQFALAKRYGQFFSMLMIDMDDFKKINDIYGHPAGDAYLRLFSEVCMRESRNVDEFARFGGDEFGFLLPCMSLKKATEFADRIRLFTEETVLHYHDLLIQTTVSIGVITWSPEIEDSERMLYLIDEALRKAKSTGKNQTIIVDHNNQAVQNC